MQLNLMTPLKIRGVTFRNRIGSSPTCQYSGIDGFVNDWHLVHLGTRAAGGAALVMNEATAVTPEGRISTADLGIWDDRHIEPLRRITTFIESQGAIPGMQLAHSGRKGSRTVPYLGGMPLTKEEGGWDIYAPSPLSFSETFNTPLTLQESHIKTLVDAFGMAAKRTIEAGFKVIEIHSAHGYLLHEFLSPISNQREDHYGGSLENRIRFPLEVVLKVRNSIPEEIPLFIRISATDWVEGGWDISQSLFFAKKLKELGVDLIDVSSGGIVAKEEVPFEKGYQVPFARLIRKEIELKTAAVGWITEPLHANQIIVDGDADLVLLGRQLFREPYWPLKAQQELGGDPTWPIPYGYALKQRR